MSNIALIGATGNIGGRVLSEALSRSHTVTAITRDPRHIMHPRAQDHPAQHFGCDDGVVGNADSHRLIIKNSTLINRE